MPIRRPPAPELVAVGALSKGDRFISPGSGVTLEVTWVHRGAPEGETFLEVRTPTGIASVSVVSDILVRRVTHAPR